MKVFTAKLILSLLSMIGHSTALKVTNITATNQTSSNTSESEFPMLHGIVDPLFAQHVKDQQAFIEKNGNDPAKWKEIHSHAKIQLNMTDPKLRYRVIDIPRIDEPLFFQQAVMIWNAKNSDKDNMAALIHNHGGGGARGNVWEMPETWF